MQIEAKNLPLMPREASNIDVWKIDDGVAFTISDSNGVIVAGVWMSKEQWEGIVSHVKARFEG